MVFLERVVCPSLCRVRDTLFLGSGAKARLLGCEAPLTERRTLICRLLFIFSQKPSILRFWKVDPALWMMREWRGRGLGSDMLEQPKPAGLELSL